MIIQTEPADVLMVRYKLYFNQQCPDPEDPWVLAYFQEHALEPRRQLEEEHEGVPYKVLHFGQCYLGRHVARLGELYQRGVEHSALAQHVAHLLATTDDPHVCAAATALARPALQEVVTALAAQLYATARFEVTAERDLEVHIEPSVVVQAFLAQPPAQSI